MSTTVLFLTVLALALVANNLVIAWLRARNLRHVAAHRGAVPAEFSENLSLESHQKAADYTAANGKLAWIEQVADLPLTLWLLFAGGIALIWSASSGLADWPISREVVLVLALSLISALVSLPFQWVHTFGVEARFGFNKMTPRLFVIDLLKGAALSAVLVALIAYPVFWLMRVAGAWWWVIAWAAFMGLQLLMQAVYPTLIAPLFNKFTPLADGEAKTAIERLLARCGFESNGLYVMDGSKRSAHGNAYFTGFGKQKRIVFFDTLLEKLSIPEIEAVLAHELGHFKRKHITKRIVLFALVSLAFFWLVDQLMHASWFAQAFGLPADALSKSPGLALILLGLALPPMLFWLSPLGALYSRKHEFEADSFAAENSDKSALISALGKLYRYNAATVTPDPLHSAWHDSHPPAPVRIAHLKAMPSRA